MIKEANEEVSKELGRIHRLMGEIDEFDLPTDEQVTTAVKSRLAELEPYLKEVPAIDELLIRAGRRVLRKQRPWSASGNDSFKDCAIWESLLEVPAGDEIVLVSKDLRAFFEKGSIDKPALASTLADEASQRGLSVVAHNDLAGVLTALKAAAPGVDEHRLAQAIDEALNDRKAALLTAWQLSLLERESFQVTPFTAGTVGSIFVEFEITYRAMLTLDDGGSDEARVRIQGSCLVQVPTYKAENVQATTEALEGLDGTIIRRNRTVYASSVRLFGRRRRPFTETRPLT